MAAQAPEFGKLLSDDPYLKPHQDDLLYRWEKYQQMLKALEDNEGGLEQFSLSYRHFGIVQRENGDVEVCEWVPNAKSVAIVGDFNNWNETAHVCNSDAFQKFRLTIPALSDGKSPIPHGSKVKLLITTHDGQTLWRMSPWTKYATQDQSVSMDFQPVHWAPPNGGYQWRHPRPSRPKSARIYEGHVGISSPEAKVASYTYFADNVLPRIKDLGYNCVELMAVMEHAYYGSFGYHVTSFFAPSSRYGTPDEFKYMVDTAHGLGLFVILDVVHSHAAKNINDGLNMFDGTDHYYFHSGGKGDHSLWDSRIFDYTQWETLRFLLSNLRWYTDEYRVDGFRYDGVTSMLYSHRGIATGFSGGYHEYFNMEVDVDAIVYIMLANQMLHTLHSSMITIAEDVSGMPTLCRPLREGGIGFDYRMAMAIPDMWIKLLKEVKDDDWNMESIWWSLTNRREHEPCIAYAECHDQSLVGDKTLAFWLMDAEMYTHMSTLSPRTVVIDRGMALHKIIRLLTMGLGGEAYLNFIGNEFGHPEWLDFPREGNGFSYHYARRQMDLIDDDLLRYKFLYRFDGAMQKLEEQHSFLTSGRGHVSRKHNGDKLIVFERGGLLWIFNFHPTKSYTGYKVGVNEGGKYRVVLDTDSKEFDGHGRVDLNCEYFTSAGDWDGRQNSLSVYVPSRTALVFAKD